MGQIREFIGMWCENHSPSKRTKVPLNESRFISTYSNHDIALQFIIIHFKQLTDRFEYFIALIWKIRFLRYKYYASLSLSNDKHGQIFETKTDHILSG